MTPMRVDISFLSASSPLSVPAPAPDPAPLPGLTVSTADDASDFVISVDGEIDIATVAVLESAVRRALASPARQIVLDLTACQFIDSTGIGTLLRLNRRLARDIARDLLILPGPAHVQRVFEVCGLVDVLPFPEEPAPRG